MDRNNLGGKYAGYTYGPYMPSKHSINPDPEDLKKDLANQDLLEADKCFAASPDVRKEKFNFNVVNAYVADLLGDDFIAVQENVYRDVTTYQFFNFYSLRGRYLESKYTTLVEFSISVAKYKTTYE